LQSKKKKRGNARLRQRLTKQPSLNQNRERNQKLPSRKTNQQKKPKKRVRQEKALLPKEEYPQKDLVCNLIRFLLSLEYRHQTNKPTCPRQ